MAVMPSIKLAWRAYAKSNHHWGDLSAYWLTCKDQNYVWVFLPMKKQY
jgi:hypothetical protein